MNKQVLYLPLLLFILVLISSVMVSALTSGTVTTNNISEEKSDQINYDFAYLDPLLGNQKINLKYSTNIEIGEPLVVTLSAPKASSKNNFKLFNYNAKKYYYPDSIIVSTEGVFVKWIINLNEMSKLILSNVNGEITSFKVQFIKNTVKNTIKIKKPDVVFKGDEFEITTLQTSDNLRELILEPTCTFETTKPNVTTIEQKFHCKIQEKTLFNLYNLEEKINSFEVKVYPSNYCDPVCNINEICENNLCKNISSLLEETCSLTSSPCVENNTCVGGICTPRKIIKEEGEYCGDEYSACADNLTCNSNKTCELFNVNSSNVEIETHCNNQDYNCQDNKTICDDRACELVDNTTLPQMVVVGVGEYCDENSHFCQNDLICDVVCKSKNITNQTNISIDENNNSKSINFNITTLKVSDDNSTLEISNNNSSLNLKKLSFQEKKIVNKTNLSKYSVKKFSNTLKDKLKIPQKATQLMTKRQELILRTELKEPRNFTLIKESNITQSAEFLTNKSRDKLTVILQRERVLKTNIAQQQEKANEKVTMKKRVIYEKENNFSNKTNKDVSTKIVIQVNPIENKTNIDVVEVIPKEVALSAQDLIYNIKPIVLEDDPVIMWHLENVTKPVELSYRVEKNISVIGNTILLSDDVKPNFDWRTLLPLLFIPLIGGLVVGFSKFEESRNKNTIN